MKRFLLCLFLVGCSAPARPRSVAEEYSRYRVIRELLKIIDESEGQGQRIALELALEVDSQDPGVLNRRARYLMSRGENDASEVSLREILRREPSYGETYLNLATLLFQRGDWNEARSLCASGKELFPMDARFRRCLELLGVEANAEGIKRGILLRLEQQLR